MGLFGWLCFMEEKEEFLIAIWGTMMLFYGEMLLVIWLIIKLKKKLIDWKQNESMFLY